MNAAYSTTLKYVYALSFLCTLSYGLMNKAQAVLSINCTASMTPSSIALGNSIALEAIENTNIGATLSYTCKNSDLSLPMNVSVCIGADGGLSEPAAVFPRYMQHLNEGTKLAFTMMLPNQIVWGSRTYPSLGAEYQSAVHTLEPGGTITVNVPIQVALLANNNNRLAGAGLYSQTFSAPNTAIIYSDSTNLRTPNCKTDATVEKIPFQFSVQATIAPSCTINTTSDIHLGSHPASQTTILGSNNNAMSMTCTNGTPYAIGLTPSNGNINGQGIMRGSSKNTDVVAYQLRSSAGTNGSIWGNTTTVSDIGNGVGRIGSGMAQTQPVYITVPDADVRPDTYSDTVTVRIQY